MRLSTRLAGISLSDDRGQSVRLGACWSERPVVFVFIRHFG